LAAEASGNQGTYCECPSIAGRDLHFVVGIASAAENSKHRNELLDRNFRLLENAARCAGFNLTVHRH
jgi:hypothetical protein